LRVSVVYCARNATWTCELEVAAGTTLRLAIERSGVLTEHPELQRDDLAVGVFSRPHPLDAPVHDGDRIEIYRPLLVDPKQARRHRAELRRRRKETAKD
jgi:putative ubiquitin-RnfH superfamily antitoxin RatB of RatAB toxin-antitoxin module